MVSYNRASYRFSNKSIWFALAPLRGIVTQAQQSGIFRSRGASLAWRFFKSSRGASSGGGACCALGVISSQNWHSSLTNNRFRYRSENRTNNQRISK